MLGATEAVEQVGAAEQLVVAVAGIQEVVRAMAASAAVAAAVGLTI